MKPAEFISENPEFLSEDPRSANFCEVVGKLWYLSLQQGQRYRTLGEGVKHIATTEFIDPRNFIALTIQFEPNSNYFPSFTIGRYLAPCPKHLKLHREDYERYAELTLNKTPLIDLRIQPCFVPEAAEFEEPIPNDLYPDWERATVKELFLNEHWLLRGPYSSFGPKTLDFMYRFVQGIGDEVFL